MSIDIFKVLDVATRVAKNSWEYGTVSEALLEWNHKDLSIWNIPFPNGQVPTLDVQSTDALNYIKDKINLTGDTLIGASGSSGDPASLGIPALMIGKTDKDFYDAAIRQKNHLLTGVPRYSNGAISHRQDQPNLWADFIYMVPPFLAYYGVAENDLVVLREAANQCKLYEEILGTQNGPWYHITGPDATDKGLWSSGNGWAAAGMSRVIATMRNGPHDAETKAEQEDLSGLIQQIIDGAIQLDTDQSGLLRNYLNDTTWFGEISGTSLIAATALRMAKLDGQRFGSKYTDWAVKKMGVVDSKVNADGIASPAVNPLGWKNKTPYTTGSPEGQAFVVLLHAAYRDWKGQ